MTYARLRQTGPDWTPAGVPSMYTQIVPLTPDMGYKALTHAVPHPESGYFNAHNAYNPDLYRVCGYKFVRRACDGSIHDHHPSPSPSPPSLR